MGIFGKSQSGAPKQAYFGLRGGWLTFWITVRGCSQTVRSNAKKEIGSLCYRYDLVRIFDPDQERYDHANIISPFEIWL